MVSGDESCGCSAHISHRRQSSRAVLGTQQNFYDWLRVRGYQFGPALIHIICVAFDQSSCFVFLDHSFFLLSSSPSQNPMPSSSSVILTAAVAAATACCGTDALHFRSGSTGDFGLGVQRLKYRERNLQLESPFGSRAANPCGNVTTNYFAEAVKDNFAAASQQEHWDAPGQRYFLNDQYWGGPGSPIFVYIGGEGPESCGTLQPGVLLMSQLAEKHSALMVDIEHRYYGESYPTANDMSNEHLAAYLTSEQALADLYVHGGRCSEAP